MENKDRADSGRRVTSGNARRVIDFVDLGIKDVPMLGWYEYHAVQPGLSTHVHPGALEICYLERGRQTYQFAGEEHRLVGGDLLVVPPGLLHDTGKSPEDCGVLYWLVLKLPQEHERLLNLTAQDSMALATKLESLPRKKFVGRPVLKGMFERLFALHDSEGTLKVLLIRHQLMCCLLEVLDCAESGKERALSEGIQRVVTRIEAQPQGKYSLRALAKEAELSLSRFKAKFKSEMGIAPREFILRVKMDSAKQALEERSVSVTRIAMELGFSSSQYFSTVFRRFNQMTPNEFRNRCVSSSREVADLAAGRTPAFENVL